MRILIWRTFTYLLHMYISYIHTYVCTKKMTRSRYHRYLYNTYLYNTPYLHTYGVHTYVSRSCKMSCSRRPATRRFRCSLKVCMYECRLAYRSGCKEFDAFMRPLRLGEFPFQFKKGPSSFLTFWKSGCFYLWVNFNRTYIYT